MIIYSNRKMARSLLVVLVMAFLLLLASGQNLVTEGDVAVAPEDDPNSPEYIDLEKLETPDFLEEVDYVMQQTQDGDSIVSVLMDLDHADAIIE